MIRSGLSSSGMVVRLPAVRWNIWALRRLYPDGVHDAERRYRTKYLPGERRYVAEVRPRERAQAVVGNEDVAAPNLVLRV